MIKLSGPYEPRAIRPLDPIVEQGWRLKFYGIRFEGELPDPEVIERARSLFVSELPGIPAEFPHYHIGFGIVHQARDGIFAILNWWVGENMVRQRVFYAPLSAPLELESISSTGITACVWELAVFWFERNAWVEEVLGAAGQPDLDAYFRRRLSTDI
jgi:hypothetical protein